MAFEVIELTDARVTEDLSMVDVVLWFSDKEYGLFDAYLMFEDFYMVFVDDDAVIATLKLSSVMPGKFEIVREIMAFRSVDEVEELISYAEEMTAADLIRLIDQYAVE